MGGIPPVNEEVNEMAILEERTVWEICRIEKEAINIAYNINWTRTKVSPTIEKIKEVVKSLEDVDSKKLLEAPLYPDDDVDGLTSIETAIIEATHHFSMLMKACLLSKRPMLIEIGKKLEKPIREFWDRCEENVFVRALESRC